jgi:plastocyanin
MLSRVITTVLYTAGVALLAACESSRSLSPGTSGGGQGGATSNVTISGFAYQPTSDTVAVNTTVTWTNQDTAPHTATSDAGSGPTWDTGSLATGVAGSHQFTTAGSFSYHCTAHPTMHGTIVVR